MAITELQRAIGLEAEPWFNKWGFVDTATQSAEDIKKTLAQAGLCVKPVLVPGQAVQHYLREYVKHSVFKAASSKARPPLTATPKLKCLYFANRFIAVTGIIGIGKTTALKKIAKYLNDNGQPAIAVEESMNDELLALFYKFMREHPDEPNIYALPLQIDMLNRCMRAYQIAALHTGTASFLPPGCPQVLPSGICWVMDGNMHSNVVFAAEHASIGNMTNPEWSAYLKSAISMGSFEIDHVLHLWGKPTLAKERIVKRGREFEKDMPLSYLKELNQGYVLNVKEQALAGHSRITVFDNTIDDLPAETYLDALLDESRVVPPCGTLGVREEEDDYPTVAVR